jgi:hypothetical protein
MFWMLATMLTVVLGAGAVSGCSAIKSASANSICQDALIKQTVVIAAALVRNIPIERYVDGMCQIASIVDPFIKDPLKPNTTAMGSAASADPIQQSLAAARVEGLIE